MSLDRAVELSSIINERSHVLDEDLRYFRGRQPLAFVGPDTRKLIKLDRLASNVCRLQTNSLVERLRPRGLTLNGKPSDQLWKDWDAADMVEKAPKLFREAMVFRSSYAIVWDHTGQKSPKVTVESARNMAVGRDPVTGEIMDAVKRWTAADKTTLVYYGPNAIETYTTNDASGTTGLTLASSVANPLGTPPVAEVLNSELVGDDGVCEFEDTKPLVDALNKILTDMMSTSEAYARPRRWAAGIEMETDKDGEPVNPFPETNRMAIAEEEGAKFGQWEANNLQAFENSAKVIVAQIQAVSSLPAHYLGTLQGSPTSADGNRSAEASLSARAEMKQASFGQGIERIGQLMQGIRTDTDPLTHRVGVSWSDPATRSVSQEADAAVKLHAEGLLSRYATLVRLGYTDIEIEADAKKLREEQVETLIAAPVAAQGRRAEQVPAGPADEPAVL